VTNGELGDVVTAVVFLAAAMGIAVGLIAELGGAAWLHPRWRRLIGMKTDEAGPRRPRLWVLPIALALLILVEATVIRSLIDAWARAEAVGVIALVLNLVGQAGWLAYLSLARERV
jgi:hypothetical protein